MGLTSTPFLLYRDIKTEETDLYEDAWGFYPQFSDIIDLLRQVKPVPGKRMTRRLIANIRKSY